MPLKKGTSPKNPSDPARTDVVHSKPPKQIIPRAPQSQSRRPEVRIPKARGR